MKQIHIALPAHNEEYAIFRTLESLRNSDYGEYQPIVHVCISNCNDGTEAEVMRFIQEYPDVKVKLHYEPRKGKYLALQKLDEEIDNDLIVFADSDCSPRPDAVLKLYESMIHASPSTLIYSGNSIDPRFTDQTKNPKNLMEAFNHIFWQRSPRRIINGQFFVARKGIVQILPEGITLDDVYLSLYYSDKFEKNDDALIIQGSPSKVSEIIDYQKRIVSGKKLVKKLLKDKISDFDKKARDLYKQFDINLIDKSKYYPNVSYLHILSSKLIVWWGNVLGYVSKPVWRQTAGSKQIAIDN